MTASEIAAVTGLGRATISTTLTRLASAGEISKAARGYVIKGGAGDGASGGAAAEAVAGLDGLARRPRSSGAGARAPACALRQRQIIDLTLPEAVRLPSRGAPVSTPSAVLRRCDSDRRVTASGQASVQNNASRSRSRETTAHDSF